VDEDEGSLSVRCRKSSPALGKHRGNPDAKRTGHHPSFVIQRLFTGIKYKHTSEQANKNRE
jgi:hypothetical protein